MNRAPTNHDFEAEPIPGILRLLTNRAKIPNFPLVCTPIDQLPHEQRDGAEPEITIRYHVDKHVQDTTIPDGKVYRRERADHVYMAVPIGPYSKIECSYSTDSAHAELEVNTTYHKLGRLTLGNVHSVGWLLRDVFNVQLLLRNYSLLHAAAIKSEDSCVVAVGLSNTGKSTTAFDLTMNGSCQLYGDDLVATDGKNIFACPYTATNISPADLPQMKHRASQWLFRNVPFYGNYGLTKRIPICSYVGSENMAHPAPATHIVFLRRSSSRSTTRITPGKAMRLLTASNRTEFTFMNSPLLCAFDYLNDTDQMDQALSFESSIFSTLINSVDCLLIEGDVPYFRETISSLVKPCC